MLDILVKKIDLRNLNFFETIFSKKVEKIETKIVKEDESNDLHDTGVEIIIPSNIIDIWTILEVLLSQNSSGNTDTLTETSNLTEELNQKCGIQTQQQYRNALDKYTTS